MVLNFGGLLRFSVGWVCFLYCWLVWFVWFGFMVIRCGFAWVGLLGRLLFGACVDWRVGALCLLF